MKSVNPKTVNPARRLWMSVAGVLLCGVSVGMFKFAAFGVDPFQALMAGLSKVIPISFGSLYLAANLVLLLFSLIFDRSKIGLATIINLSVLGYVVEYTQQFLVDVLPGALWPRVLMLVIGLFVLSFSSSLYFTADLGVSTYDAIALVIHARRPTVPFSYCRIGTDVFCLVLGVLLFFLSGEPFPHIGDVVGIGTVITAICLGPMIDYCNTHFSGKILDFHQQQKGKKQAPDQPVFSKASTP